MVTRNLIVFLLPPEKIVSGGILSIFSLCEETRLLKDIHGCDTELAILPGFPSYRHNDTFDNDEFVYAFDELMKQNQKINKLLIHIPEYLVPHVTHVLGQYANILQRVGDLSFNILNQNILLMPDEISTASLFRLSPNITQTTAHQRYSTKEQAKKYCMPVHHMSVFIDPSQYIKVPFEKKNKVIAFSPDTHPYRKRIIQKLKKELPDYTITTVKNMSYEDYKSLIAQARFTISLGEGLDGYTIESTFTNGIGFTMYNDDFFDDSSYLQLKTIYNSPEDLYLNITKDIRELEDPTKYRLASAAMYEKLSRIYNTKTYREKIKKFYLEDYDYYAAPADYNRLLGEVLRQRDSAVFERDQRISELEGALSKEQQQISMLTSVASQQALDIKDLNSALRDIYASTSWRITKPLRKIRGSR